jgi:hypothetical protein
MKILTVVVVIVDRDCWWSLKCNVVGSEGLEDWTDWSRCHFFERDDYQSLAVFHFNFLKSIFEKLSDVWLDANLP